MRSAHPVLLLLALPATALAEAPYRVYAHTQAQVALRIAQRECKPLVLHFVPNEAIGNQQRSAYYGKKSPIPRADLDRLVVVIIPRDRYPQFADAMNIDDAGGLRTVSPYELTFTDRFGLTTVRETVQYLQTKT